MSISPRRCKKRRERPALAFAPTYPSPLSSIGDSAHACL